MRMGTAPDRPFVTLSYAQSLDGSIAARRGRPLALSSPESLRMTHEIRARHDAILVGIGTVLADDPQLTVRLVEGNDPQPVILDSLLRFPVTARLMGNARKPWIITLEGTSLLRKQILEDAGARVIPVIANQDHRVSLSAMLENLRPLGIKTLMVEGGSQVITAFLRARLVDEVILTLSPVFVGGLYAVESLLPEHFPRLGAVTVEPCGLDWIVRGRLIAGG